jgi:hypothetical protein
MGLEGTVFKKAVRVELQRKQHEHRDARTS